MVSPDGSIRFGPFRILERLGEGGMCYVFRARRDGEDRDCALKLLKDSARNDERARELFATEAEVALLVDHPNLIRTHDAGRIDKRNFIAMELVEGTTVAALAESLARHDLAMPPDLAMFIVSELLEGLHALHEACSETGEPLGLVHRDVTPDNMFLGFDGRVLLGDFGVAHVEAFGDVNPEHAVGKLGYMAPELLGDAPPDRRADIFSAGVILFELMTGSRLFEAEDEDEGLAMLAEARVPRLSSVFVDIDRKLESVVTRALARRARDRFETAEEMAVELETHWSKLIGNPFALQALVASTFPTEAQAWSSRSTSGARQSITTAWPVG